MRLVEYFLLVSLPKESFNIDYKLGELSLKKKLLGYEVCYYFRPPILWGQIFKPCDHRVIADQMKIGFCELEYERFTILKKLEIFDTRMAIRWHQFIIDSANI